MTLTTASSRVDNIRRSLVGLKMPRALEMLDTTLRRIEHGQIQVCWISFPVRAEIHHVLLSFCSLFVEAHLVRHIPRRSLLLKVCSNGT